MSQLVLDDLRQLTDEDVEILYSIVITAQNSSKPPFRALFTAYDTVLAQHGIRPDHDQLYFRFLLRMGEERNAHESLFAQFEALLAKLGFQLDFSEDEKEEEEEEEDEHSDGDNETADVNREVGKTDDYSGEVEHRGHSQLQSHKSDHGLWNQGRIGQSPHAPSRRASFDYSELTRMTPDSKQVGLGLNSAAHLYSKDISPQKVARLRRASASPIIRDSLRAADGFSHFGRGINVEDRDTRAHPEPLYRNVDPRLENRNSPPKFTNVEKARKKPSYGNNYFRPSLENEDVYAKASALRSHEDLQHALDGNELYQPQKTTLTTAHRDPIAVRSAIERGPHDQAVQNDAIREVYERAVDQDRQTLLRQSFAQWLAVFQTRRHARQERATLKILQARAAKARDMFLLSKAFTHWAQSASDEALRTAVAKRHVIRARCFKNWRELALNNEASIRQFVLIKFLRTWKRRWNDVEAFSETAEYFDESRLIGTFYRQWFWQFCERRVPFWSNENLKLRIFEKWVNRTRLTLDEDYHAITHRSAELARQVFFQLRAHLDRNLQRNLEADRFRRFRLLSDAMTKIRIETRFAPLVVRFEQCIESRIANAQLQCWKQRSQLMTLAGRVNKMRTLRNSWTSWNDHLRCRSLSRTIDDRVVVQALYKWVLAGRIALSGRVTAQRLKGNMFTRWRTKCQEACDSLGQATFDLTQYTQTSAKTNLLKTWSRLLQERQQLNTMAAQFRQKSLIRYMLQHWRSETGKIRLLQNWVDDARFYSLATKSLHAWRAKKETTQRQKRSAAYSTMRRIIKTHAAANIMNAWLSKARAVSALDEVANDNSEQILRIRTKQYQVLWMQKTMRTNADLIHAAEIYRDSLIYNTFRKLRTKYEQIKEAIYRADDFFYGLSETAATTMIRKLNWQLFQVRLQQETASSLEERNRKKHYRNMLTYWADKTAGRRRDLPDVVEDTQVADERITSLTTLMTDDDEVGLDMGFEIARTPAYLMTPSKKGLRARSRLQTPRTPASTYSYQVDTVSASRGDFTRRLRGLAQSDFAGIPETSPLRGN